MTNLQPVTPFTALRDPSERLNDFNTAIARVNAAIAGLGIPRNYQVIGSHNGLYNAIWGNGAGGRTDTLSYNRRFSIIGASDVSSLKLGFAGYYIKNDASGEHAFGNDYTAQAAFEITSPANYFNAYAFGSQAINVPNGIDLLLTDIGQGIPVAAGSTLWMRQQFGVASSSGDVFPSTSQTAVSSGALKETGFVAPSIATSQVSATGDMTTVSGATSFGGALPFILLGIPVTPMASVAFLGDSIADGTGDTVDVASGALGFIARGLNSVNGYTMSALRQTVGGDRFSQNTLITAPRKRSLWPYCTHLLIELGTNDISAGTTLSAMQTYVTNILTAAKRTMSPYGKPLQTAMSTIMPRTTSTDSWASASGQTPVAGFEVGTGVRDLYNAWLATLVGQGLLDKLINVNPYVEDQSTPGAWVTNGTANYPTTDGVHPTKAVHILAAQAVNAWAIGIRP